ncbi:MAG: TonB-dependent receptor plug domain-containing protein [Gemmatimonadaceae bacterium]
MERRSHGLAIATVVFALATVASPAQAQRDSATVARFDSGRMRPALVDTLRQAPISHNRPLATGSAKGMPCVKAMACEKGIGSVKATDDVKGTDVVNRTDSAKATLARVQIQGRVDDLRGIARSASEGHVGAAELRMRPLVREGELLETVPGVIVTQHSGDGKANQLFVRGFNLDHGTDFRTTVEGMPLNMPSHAHGQGYTDLNFLIPELIDHIDYSLGVYHASLGDFGSAGGAEFGLVRSLDRPFLTLGAGGDGFARVVGARSSAVGGGTLLLGGEAKSYDGPWQVQERERKYSGMVRYSRQRGASQLSLLGMAYRNRWNASDQIPQRAVADGRVDRFGQIDPSLGGATERYSVSGSLQRLSGSTIQRVNLFAVYSRLDLYSNFTYGLENPVTGDQINQREHRLVFGGSASRTHQYEALRTEHTVTMGVQQRLDLVRGLGLFRTERRQRTGTVREDDVTESATGAYVEVDSRWHPRLRSTLGARADGYAFQVTSDILANGGRRSAGIASPKASLVFSAGRGTELYLSGGFGFHSNDARGTTITVDPVTRDSVSRVSPLVRSRGGELGVRYSPRGTWRSTVALWGLDLDSELLFVGDGGATEPSGASRRSGVTFANWYRPLPSLALDADVSFARARSRTARDAGSFLPGALEKVVAAGATWGSASGGSLALRVRHFGSYPLVEDNAVRARATTLVNAEAGFRVGQARVRVGMLNLLNRQASDIQYYYASRLPGEPVGGIEDVHFHPVEPRQVRVSVGRGF